MKTIAEVIKKIEKECTYRELDESVQGVVSKIDTDKFYQRVMGIIDMIELINKEENEHN
jgi:hypothetical protein